MRKEVIFYSEGFKISGHLYTPESNTGNKKYPAIILCHGFAGIKEALLPPFAEGFLKSGFVTLVFDYRGFGGSEGERGWIIPSLQVKDIRNAITYMETLPEVDSEKIALWGSSFGGANAITVAARDKRVKAVVAQLTFGNGERVVTGNLKPEEKEKLFSTLKKISQRLVTQNKNMMMGLSQILTDADSKEFFGKIIAEHPVINIKIPFLFVKESIEYKPEEVIGKIKVPVMILGAENDIVNPPEESRMLFERANEPKEIVMIKDATHYQVYSGPKFEEAFNAELAFLRKYL
jgi:alpha-beta hydrolase superfamily lysophospholipase